MTKIYILNKYYGGSGLNWKIFLLNLVFFYLLPHNLEAAQKFRDRMFPIPKSLFKGLQIVFLKWKKRITPYDDWAFGYLFLNTIMIVSNITWAAVLAEIIIIVLSSVYKKWRTDRLSKCSFVYTNIKINVVNVKDLWIVHVEPEWQFQVTFLS